MNFVNYLIEAASLDISIAVLYIYNGARPSVKNQLYFRKVSFLFALSDDSVS